MVPEVPGPYPQLLQEFGDYQAIGLDRIGKKRIQRLLDNTLAYIKSMPEGEREYRELYTHMAESIGLSRLNLYHTLKLAEHAFRLGLHYNRRSLDNKIDSNPILAEHYLSHCLTAYQKLEREKGIHTFTTDNLKRIRVVTQLWETLKPTDETYSPLSLKARQQLLKNRYRG